MAWTSSVNGKAGNKGHIPAPVNFTPATAPLEAEQWQVASAAAQLIMQSRVVGNSGNYTVSLSGTTTAGHQVGDTITVTVTSA